MRRVNTQTSDVLEAARVAGLSAEQMNLNADLGSQMTERFNVAGALLVAPADVDREGAPDALKAFAPSPVNPLPFPSIVVASSVPAPAWRAAPARPGESSSRPSTLCRSRVRRV